MRRDDIASQRLFARSPRERIDAELPLYAPRALENPYAANTDLKNFRPNTVTSFDDFMDVDI